MKEKKKRDAGKAMSGAVMLFFFSAFLLLFLRDFVWYGLALAFGVPAMIWLGTNFIPRLFPSDRLLLSLTNFLCALGVLVLYDTNPTYAYQQAINYGIGILCMIACVWIMRMVHRWRGIIWLMIPASLGLLVLPLLIGRETNGATNWIYIGSMSLQPSEVVKLSLILIIAWFMSRKKFFLWLIFAVACLGILMLQADLGTALLYYGTTLLLYYASCGNLWMTGLGLAGGAGAAFIGYKRFAHVKKRVAIWLNPWANYNTGYQIIQGLMAIASGGLLGVGLGLGSPTTIPVYFTDYIFAVICEQFGLIFGVCVLLMYVAIIWRGATIAMAARHSFHGLVAMGCTIMIALQTFVIIGGVIKLIPLTGVTMPFVSYGGTSLVSSMCLIGLLQGVGSINEDDLKEDMRLADFGSATMT